MSSIHSSTMKPNRARVCTGLPLLRPGVARLASGDLLAQFMLRDIAERLFGKDVSTR